MNSQVIEQLLDSFQNYAPVRVPVSDLIKTLSGSCDYGEGESWLVGIFNMKLADREMGWLIDSVLENGLVTPLNVIRKEGRRFEMGNGHHRLCAMLLSGFDTVDVVVDGCMNFWNSEDHSLDMSYSSEADESYSSLYPWLLDVYYSAVFAKEMA